MKKRSVTTTLLLVALVLLLSQSVSGACDECYLVEYDQNTYAPVCLDIAPGGHFLCWAQRLVLGCILVFECEFDAPVA